MNAPRDRCDALELLLSRRQELITKKWFGGGLTEKDENDLAEVRRDLDVIEMLQFFP